ncbi:Os06g0702300 [Oryza sativa Japonica Group]|uniref:Os06g0702300 protein n=1 Tax=Oryza sativa subsp. japonica TaxID=39947 RepID=A0A0P0X0U7_ORYSJ|nr:Os06g0702300 [Oryza sativa Japonica Group]
MATENSSPAFTDFLPRALSPIPFGRRHSCARHGDIMMNIDQAEDSCSNISGASRSSQSHTDQTEDSKGNELCTRVKAVTDVSCGSELQDTCEEEGIILWPGLKMSFPQAPLVRIQDNELDYAYVDVSETSIGNSFFITQFNLPLSLPVYVVLCLSFPVPSRNACKQLAANPEAPLFRLPPLGSYEKEMCGPVLLICNVHSPGMSCFSPYTKSTFYRENMEIDIDDVLYSNGSWFLLREANIISLWNVNTEKRWFVGEAEEIIHQGYFIGNPPFDVTIALARQHPPKLGEEAITAIWLRSVKIGGWSKGSVRCDYEHSGLNSLTIHQGMLFWLTDSGSLCCARQTSEGLELMIWNGSVRIYGMNFSLVKHFDDLYIVNGGGFFPNEVAKSYQIVVGDELLVDEKRLKGKDVFTVSRQGGFVLPSSEADNGKLFTGNMIPDVDCSM